MGQIEIDTSKYGREPDWDDLPVLPTRNLVMFPGVTVPLSIGREGSLKLAERAAETCTPIAVICQTDAGDNNPNMRGLYKYGVVADVFKVLQLPDETHTALLRARSRFRVLGKGVRAAESPTGLSVRAVEQIVREGLTPAGQTARPKARPNHEYDEFAKNLSHRFSAPVKFSRNADGKGSITFKFSSDDELHALIKAFDS